MHGFRSDNNAGLCPEAAQAILDANDGHRFAYGDDDFTQEAVGLIREIFGEGTSAWFVATGTAANTLAIAALTRPWERVLCHVHSHYSDDESTAPERITQCRTVQIHTDAAKLEPSDLEKAGQVRGGDVHEPQPGVVTLSNPTEFGCVYTAATVWGDANSAASTVAANSGVPAKVNRMLSAARDGSRNGRATLPGAAACALSCGYAGA